MTPKDLKDYQKRRMQLWADAYIASINKDSEHCFSNADFALKQFDARFEKEVLKEPKTLIEAWTEYCAMADKSHIKSIGFIHEGKMYLTISILGNDNVWTWQQPMLLKNQ